MIKVLLTNEVTRKKRIHILDPTESRQGLVNSKNYICDVALLLARVK